MCYQHCYSSFVRRLRTVQEKNGLVVEEILINVGSDELKNLSLMTAISSAFGQSPFHYLFPRQERNRIVVGNSNWNTPDHYHQYFVWASPQVDCFVCHF